MSQTGTVLVNRALRSTPTSHFSQHEKRDSKSHPSSNPPFEKLMFLVQLIRIIICSKGKTSSLFSQRAEFARFVKKRFCCAHSRITHAGPCTEAILGRFTFAPEYKAFCGDAGRPNQAACGPERVYVARAPLHAVRITKIAIWQMLFPWVLPQKYSWGLLVQRRWRTCMLQTTLFLLSMFQML